MPVTLAAIFFFYSFPLLLFSFSLFSFFSEIAQLTDTHLSVIMEVALAQMLKLALVS
jgi:cell shape-determining protein MreC